MPSKNPKVRVKRSTYDAIADLARRWNVSMPKVIDILVQHAFSCNRIGTSIDYPPATRTNPNESDKQPLWWQMCADTLWVCEGIINALLRLADIYPDLKADWLHTPYEAARRLEVVAKDWGLIQGQPTDEEISEEATEQQAENP